MKILLTGATGQVGQALQKQLAGAHTLIAPDLTQMDLSRPEQITATIRSVQPDLIINPAAYTAVDQAESEAALAYAINAEALAVMAAEAKVLGIGLIHYSTDYVFDGSKADVAGNWLAYDETDATGPLNVYGASKLAGEQALRASGCAHLILRTSWVYSLTGKNFLLTMLRLANEREELRVVDDQWGAPTFAGWIAHATAAIVVSLSQAGNAGDWWRDNGGVLNLCTAGHTSWCGFTEEIVRQASARGLLRGAAPRVTGIPASEYPTPAKRPCNSRLDTSLLARRFHLTIPSWQEALSACLAEA